MRAPSPAPPGTAGPKHARFGAELRSRRGRDGTRGCCGMGVRECGRETAAQRRPGPPVPEPAPTPRKAPVRGFLRKSFCGEETSFLHMQNPSNSILSCGQTTFSAAINHSPRSSPLARACRHPGTVPTGFGTSFDFGEICKTIFINNIRIFIFNNPVCKAKQGLPGAGGGSSAPQNPAGEDAVGHGLC